MLCAGPLEVDLARRITRVGGGGPLNLKPHEWDLLATPARAGASRVVTQRQLLTAVWGPAHADDAQCLRTYISHLRQKLGPDAARLILASATASASRSREGPTDPAEGRKLHGGHSSAPFRRMRVTEPRPIRMRELQVVEDDGGAEGTASA